MYLQGKTFILKMVAFCLFETIVRYLPKPHSLNTSEGKRLFCGVYGMYVLIRYGMVWYIWYGSYGVHVYGNVMGWNLEQTNVS